MCACVSYYSDFSPTHYYDHFPNLCNILNGSIQIHLEKKKTNSFRECILIDLTVPWVLNIEAVYIFCNYKSRCDAHSHTESCFLIWDYSSKRDFQVKDAWVQGHLDLVYHC